MVGKTQLKRVSKEMADLINFIKAKHLMAGKKPPSDRAITKAIVRKVKKEALLKDEFIIFR